MENLIISVIGLVASLSSILFAFLAFRRSDKADQRKEVRNEGTILSDIDTSRRVSTAWRNP